MRSTTRRRLDKVADVMGTIPLPEPMVTAAFDAFRQEGELPDDDRLAAAVIDRALGRDPRTSYYDNLIRITVVTHLPEKAPRISMRECLFDEALHGSPFVRRAARAALQLAACRGADVTDERWLAEMPEPEFGSVGLKLLNWPEVLIRAPYEERGAALLSRYRTLRSRIDQDDASWFERMLDAVLAFEDHGTLPSDEFMRDVVLADAEFELLWRHRSGLDVREDLERIDALRASVA